MNVVSEKSASIKESNTMFEFESAIEATGQPNNNIHETVIMSNGPLEKLKN